jgi:diguanylate cyclase (GGDEF)-like protein
MRSTDRLTGLPGRSVLRMVLGRELAIGGPGRTPLSLVLFNADDFVEVNAEHGRAVGDDVLREIVARAQATLRGSDPLCRHGGATFAVPLPHAGREAALLVADRLHAALSDTPYRGGAITLSFSVALTSVAQDDTIGADPVDFIGRAEVALAMARRSGGARVCVWRHAAVEPAEPVDRLRHVFSGDQDRDYRSMGLLWDTVGLLATTSTPLDLAKQVTAQLRRALSAAIVALFEPGERGLALTFGRERRQKGEEDRPLDPSSLSGDQSTSVTRAAEGRTPVWVETGPTATRRAVTCAVPLLVDGGLVGVLLIAGTSGYLTIDERDQRFMAGLAGPLGHALERARRAERRRAQDEAEKRRLVGELNGLRHALRQARLVYASRRMEDVIAIAQRVADTDATVLVLGESGTGKEMLAQSIHQMSSRRSRPLVVVDCGAIPSSLIESELFGHERGAFTGALTKSIGRLAQADGGTVLLDEIGELPLDVQSKLLRFVQEKQVTAVGSSVVRRVDVRVLAATNRDLADEVARGRFRGDLYHRLNVIALVIPPLRERAEDILELARHFLEHFAPKYQKAVRALGADVEQALTRYDWPGNVRELQNRILRAVIMSTGETLTPDDLSLPVAPASANVPDARPHALPSPGAGDGRTHDLAPVPIPAAWATLGARLDAVVASMTSKPGAVHLPIGRWLANDLVQAAFDVSDGVARRAAVRIGLPETTYIRHLRRAQREAEVVRRPLDWEPVTRAAQRLVHVHAHPSGDVLDAAEAQLLGIIVRHVPPNTNAAASLLGVSLPTLRRRLESVRVAC